MGNRILIIGGGGFIGFHLAKKLCEDPHNQITICDNLSRGKMDEDLKRLLSDCSNIHFIKADLTKKDDFQKLDNGYEHVYMLASVVGVKYTEETPERVIRINSYLILNVLDWLIQNRCSKVLFSSTSETYAGGAIFYNIPIPTPEDVPLTIVDVTNPRFSYAITKILGEAGFIHYARAYNFRVTIVRYHNIYGPRMGFEHVVPELCMRIIHRKDPFQIFGVEQTRAFCYITDAVDATIKVMYSENTDSQIVHIGNDQEEILIEELAKKLFRISGFYPKLHFLPSHKGSVPRRCPDISKLAGLTGFAPKVSLDEGLKKTYDWYSNHLN